MRFPLTQGAYQARGPIANAQQCYNLYPEPNTPDAPFPMSHYPAPGLSLWYDFSQLGISGPVRGLYQASNGFMFCVVGTWVTSFQSGAASPTLLGQMIATSNDPVSMCDNQTDLVIVEGSSNNGYYVPLSQSNVPNSLVQINDPAFYGSTRVDFIDTFLIFNWPGTPTWYSTISNELLPFDAQYFAGKEGYNDYTVAVAALHDNVWVLGNFTTEIWFNAGGALFPFARMPNSVLQQGCVAPYAVVVADNAIYWISQDRWGRNMLIRGEGYSARRVSTFAVEEAWSQYTTPQECRGMAFQTSGHEFIGFYFPQDNAYWVYDASTQQWHQRTYNGLSQAWPINCMAFWGTVSWNEWNGLILAGSALGPQLHSLSRNYYTDFGAPIIRQRTWMHVVNDGRRQVHSRFQASFGSSLSGGNVYPDELDLTWSDDGGVTWGATVPQTVNQATNGSYLWRRLGYARDRVYALTWNAQGEATLNGAWIDLIPQAT